MDTNHVFFMIHGICAVVAFGGMITASRNHTSGFLRGMCAAVCAWALLRIPFYLFEDSFLLVSSTTLSAALHLASLVCFFFFALQFFHYDSQTHRLIALVLFSPSVSMLVASFWPPESDVFLQHPVVTTEAFHHISGDVTPLFLLYAFVAVTVTFASFCMALYAYLQLPSVYRISVNAALVSTSLVLVAGVFAAFFETLSIIPLLIMTVISIVSVWFARSNDEIKGLYQVKSDIFRSLDQAVIICDDSMNIVVSNRAGDDLLQQLQLYEKKDALHFSSVMDALMMEATQYVRLEEETGGMDFTFDSKDGHSKTFNLREKNIVDKRGRSIATLIVYTNVTENRALLQRLEVSVGRDALTGLCNRNMMEFFKTDMDKPNAYPLSVILCDLNNLKVVNDTKGHQQGDLMLRIAGEALYSCCPPTAQVGRIGGDEFLVLLPNTTLEQANALIAQIETNLEHSSRKNAADLVVTLAMGAATKDTATQQVAECIDTADKLMYEHKKKIKLAHGWAMR